MATLACLAALSGCGSSPQPPQSAHELLLQAKTVLDSTPALHFHLSSSNAQGGDTMITGADGDAHRPDGFRGTLTVVQSGFNVTVHVISANGYFYVQLPFTSSYEATDPSKYGFGDPATLLDPNLGLSSLLTSATNAKVSDNDRLNGEELYEIDVTLPGDKVAALLTSADKSQPVKGRVGIATSNKQVRRVVLTGPFFDRSKQSTYTLVLDKYGENVAITPPA